VGLFRSKSLHNLLGTGWAGRAGSFPTARLWCPDFARTQLSIDQLQMV